MISKDKESIDVEVVRENETLLAILRNKLLQDPKVANATFVLGHPLLDNPKIHVSVREGKPQTALKRAAKAIGNEYHQFASLFEKAVQSRR